MFPHLAKAPSGIDRARLGRYYTVLQVRLIYECIGLPVVLFLQLSVISNETILDLQYLSVAA